MKNNIELSIIIPIYNGEKHINNLISNIRDLNSDVNFEILLIDDASKDDSSLVCKEAIKKNSKLSIKYIRNNNNIGIAKTRNVGIDNAKGKYITFVDQDDSLEKGYRNFIDLLEKEKFDFISTNYLKEENSFRKECSLNKNSISCNREMIIDLERKLFNATLLPINNKDITISTTVWNCIFNLKFIKENKIHFFNFTSYEDDWIFVIECLKNAKKLYLSSEYYYCYKIHNKSRSNKQIYIDNYYDKSIALLEYANESLIKTGLNENDLIKYNECCKKTIRVWVFYNECLKGYGNCKNNKLFKLKNNEYEIFSKYSSKYEKIILFFMHNDLLLLAYILQRCINKKFV